jgi:hypothetical protein
MLNRRQFTFASLAALAAPSALAASSVEDWSATLELIQTDLGLMVGVDVTNTGSEAVEIDATGVSLLVDLGGEAELVHLSNAQRRGRQTRAGYRPTWHRLDAGASHRSLLEVSSLPDGVRSIVVTMVNIRTPTKRIQLPGQTLALPVKDA